LPRKSNKFILIELPDMKTSGKNSKTRKTSGNGETLKNIEDSVSKSVLKEEDIREKALEIYNQRIERGEHRNAAEDWLEAEEYLRESEG
jgi:hypothetical protein